MTRNMHRLQFSILDLLIGTAFFAFGCAALKGQSSLWLSTTVTGTVVLLTLASFGAWYSEGHIKSFRTGFAVTGWLFFLLPRVPGISSVHSQLLSTDLSRYVGRYIRPDIYYIDASGKITGGSGSILYDGISQCLAALLIGLLGGILAVHLYGKREVRHRQ